MGLLLTSLVRRLEKIYSTQEARAMARRLLEEPPMELPPSLLFTGSKHDLSPAQRDILRTSVSRLEAGEPLQYVMGHEYFAGLCLKVGPGVLIPRPETQDLADWMVYDFMRVEHPLFLDACTGSGCIAAALASQLPTAQIMAVDLSGQALSYARENTEEFRERVRVIQQDILSEDLASEPLDALVSNPPYILEKERKDMDDNVRKFEPEMALFVPDEDPLVFYRRLARIGQDLLKSKGLIYFEINQNLSHEVCQLLLSLGYVSVECRKDRFDCPRMVRGVKK